MTSEPAKAPVINLPQGNEVDDDEEYIEEERMIPPDGGWGWIVIISGFFAHVLSDGVMYAFGVILDELMTVFKVSATEVTFVGSLLPAVILGIGPLASTLITLFGARAITIAGSIIAGLSLIVSTFAPSLFFLSISVGVFCGIGFGIVYLPAIVMVSYYFEKRRSLAMGITVAGSGVGTVALPPLLRMLIHEYGWRGTFLVLGALVFNCIACGLVLLPLKPTKVLVKKPKEMPGNFSLVDMITKNSEEKDSTVATNGNGLNGHGNGAKTDIKEGNNNQENGSAIPEEMSLLGGQKKEIMLLIPDDQVKYRRGLSHSPQGTASEVRPRHNSDNREGALSAGAASPSRTESKMKQISIHHSQLLPEQRRNPDLIMRPDLRYPHSLTHIPLYQSNRDIFVRQVSHFVSESSIPVDVDEVDASKKPSLWTQLVESLRQSFDFTLFKDIPFLIFSLSSFMTSLGYNAPYLYIVVWAHKELHFTEDEAAMLSSFIGVGNIIGRLFFGIIADSPKVSRMLLYIIALILCGAVTCVSPLYASYWWMVTYAVLFGALIGAYVGLTPLILVDLLGLHRLEVAFGILGLVQFVATLAGPPVLAALRDATGSFNILFFTCGSVIALSGVMLIPVYIFYEKLRSGVTTEEQALGRAKTLVADDDENDDTQQIDFKPVHA